jgi:hypothetical protein
MTLSMDIAVMRGAIKHAPEQVDLQDVRQLLGECEDAVNLLEDLTGPETDIATYAYVTEDGMVGHRFIIKGDAVNRESIYRWIGGR